MNFDSPLPWSEALKIISDKTAMPTDQGSAALSSLPSDIRKYSLFSARTTSAAYLEEIRKVLQDYADGKINLADARMKLQAWLKDACYTPEGGFPRSAGVSPAEEGVPPASSLLQNLASKPRIKLVVETGARLAQSTAFLQSFQTPAALFDFPCMEFRRLYWRKHPRGESGRDSDPAWQERWVRSGGKLYDGRMIARTDDDVWDNISDSGIWPDGLDSDADPVVFNTGYGRVPVSRAEAVSLGVIGPDDGVKAENIRLVGQMFDNPARATLADYAAKKQDMIAALADLKKAA